MKYALIALALVGCKQDSKLYKSFEVKHVICEEAFELPPSATILASQGFVGDLNVAVELHEQGNKYVARYCDDAVITFVTE